MVAIRAAFVQPYRISCRPVYSKPLVNWQIAHLDYILFAVYLIGLYHFLAELAAAGKALVIISSDMSEVIGMAHRVAVMHQGAIAGFLSGDEITEHEIMRYATGLKAAAA